jgi:DNA-binding transcriptional MocR family regulator
MSQDNASAILAELRAAALDADAGARLPSVRELARRHRASPVTVQRALSRLTAEGLVEPRPGRGTFVAPRLAPVPPAAPAAPDRPDPDGAPAAAASTPAPPARPAAPGPADLSWQALALGSRAVDAAGLPALLALPAADAIPLSSGFPDDALLPIAALTAATTRAARRPGAWGRLAVEGNEALRAWFARAAGGGLRAHDVLVSPGGQAALGTILRALARPGDAIVVESPTYLGALAVARTAGLRVIPVPTDADGVRPDALDDALARSGARIAYLQPTFANPTGAVLSPTRRAAVLEVVRARSAFVVEDDWARDLAIDGDPPPPLSAADADGHVIHLRSLTKSVAPGLRVAGVAARGAAGARLRDARVVDDFFVSGVLQEAALELLASPAWRRHQRTLRTALRRRRDTLVRALAEHLPDARLAGGPPRGGQHLWLALPDEVDDVALAARAAAAGVIVSPGRAWFPADPPGSFLRVSFTGAPEEALVEGVRRLAAAWPA